MGFLDHSTNNILLDCVLTDVGRQFLARNDGSFSIAKFAFGDDEIDYSTIKKFGRTVGKEKIEKNTPIFEALTNQNIAQKYRLVHVDNPNLIRLPSLSLDANVASFDMGRTTTRQKTISLTQTITNETIIDSDLIEVTFEVKMNNLFLQIAGATPDYVDAYQNARYILVGGTKQTPQGGSRLTFTLELKPITDAQFTVFGTTQDDTIIKTYVTVTGQKSGAVKEFEVQISKTG